MSEKIQVVIKNQVLKKISLIIVALVFLLYSLIIFVNNFNRINSFRSDFTAENLGRDLLASITKNGIVNFNDDTSLYDSQYVHYVLKERPDVKIIDFDLLKDKNYRISLNKHFPTLYLPDVKKLDLDFMKEFLEKNSKSFDIFSSGPNALVSEVWLPNGLLWKYYPTYQKLPSPKQLIYTNLVLWLNFHRPFSGALGKYQTLLLSDVLRVYALGHQGFGMMLYKNKEYKLAANEFKDAINYLPEIPDNYLNLAKSYIDSKNCLDAEKTLDTAVKIYKNNKQIYKNYIDLYANCFRNEEKITKYYKIYEKLKQQSSL